MIGSPGCGKSMLAKRFKGILPMLSFEEALEVTKVYSVSSLLKDKFSYEVPYRSPHSSATAISITGGGVPIRPGEVSLAHNGILFLDELTEFKRYVIEQLRQIMDDREVTVSKGNRSHVYPADFLLIAACNPCPCGYLGDREKACSCTSSQIQRYLAKLSGPLLDRIDIHIELSRLNRDEFEELGDSYSASSKEPLTPILREKVQKAKSFEKSLRKDLRIKTLLALDKETKAFLHNAVFNLNISARSYEKVVKIARTIANLEESEAIKLEHIAEALQFRAVNFDSWRQIPALNGI